MARPMIEAGELKGSNQKGSVKATASERRKSAKREVILKAAHRVFLEYGFPGATTDMIQARAGVSKSTLYSHFSSKEELFEAVCHLSSEDFVARIREVTEDVAEEPHKYLSRFGVKFLNILFSDDGKAYYRLMIDNGLAFPHLGKYFYGAGVKAATDMIECYLAQAHARGKMVVDWPALSSEHFMGMLRGDLHLRVMLNIGRPPTQEQIEKYVDLTVSRFLNAHGAT